MVSSSQLGFQPLLNIGSICDSSQNAAIPFACSNVFAIPNRWEPQCFKVKEMFGFRTASIERIERFYNSRYDEICEAVYPKDLLKLPDTNQ
jgi:hypothetical protein